MASLYKKSVDKNTEDKPTRYFSNRQEKSVAKAVNGKTTANSGATPWQKGDVLINSEVSWLLECKTKTVDSKSFSIKKEWLEKNKLESLFMGKDYSALVFNFGPNQENYYIIDEFTFQELLEYQKDKLQNDKK